MEAEAAERESGALRPLPFDEREHVLLCEVRGRGPLSSRRGPALDVESLCALMQVMVLLLMMPCASKFSTLGTC